MHGKREDEAPAIRRLGDMGPPPPRPPRDGLELSLWPPGSGRPVKHENDGVTGAPRDVVQMAFALVMYHALELAATGQLDVQRS